MNWFQKLKTKVLAALASPLPKNRLSHTRTYPQLWYYMPRNKLARGALQFLCGLIGGHELSETEWGYGGGPYADRWCRWCGKLIKVPKESVWFRWREARELMKLVE